MSAAKHTPGPWFTKREGFSTVYVEARIGQGMLQEVAACGPTEAGPAQQDANARLISAAPDLLDVARKFVAWSEAENNHKETTFWERVDMVRELDAAAAAAIAKAEGAQ